MYVTQFLSPRNKDTPPDDPVFPPSAEASAHSHCSLLSHTGISDETCIPSADVLQRQPHLSKRLTFLPAVPDLQPVLPVSVLLYTDVPDVLSLLLKEWEAHRLSLYNLQRSQL